VQPELQAKVITFGKVLMSSPCKKGVVEYSMDKTRQSYCRTTNKIHVVKTTKEEPRQVLKE